jgi:hypothetical protein
LTAEEAARIVETLRDGVGLPRVEDAIARAYRRKPDAAGRHFRIGAHVGKLVRQLLFWQGKGQDPDGRIFKSLPDWEHSDAAFTRSKLATAARVAREEMLASVEPGLRPSDRRQTNFYGLHVWEVAWTVVTSELDSIGRRLERESRKRERDKLNRERRKLEGFRDHLTDLAEHHYANPEPEIEHAQLEHLTSSSSEGTPRKLSGDPTQVARTTDGTPDATPDENGRNSSLQAVVGDAKKPRRPPAAQGKGERIELPDEPIGAEDPDAAEAGGLDEADAEEVEAAPGPPRYDAESNPEYARILELVGDPEGDIGRLARLVAAGEADSEDLVLAAAGGNVIKAQFLRGLVRQALEELSAGVPS